MTQQPARDQGCATRGGGVDTPENKRQCHDKRHEEEMEFTDAMATATTEEDASGVGM